jgi:hypothetical protein
MNHDKVDRETTVSLLHTIALIREAAGVDEDPMLSELPSVIGRLRYERDEARRRVCEMSLQLGQIYRRVGGKSVEVTTAEGVADMMGWDCYNDEYKRRRSALDNIARIDEELGLD